MDNNLTTWIKCWEEDDTTWLLDHVHPCLPRHCSKLLGDKKSGKRIFIPLCGNTIAIKWFADLGNTVIGVDISHKAIKSFFKQHDIVYNIEKMTDSSDDKIFISEDRKIQIYCCNLYQTSFKNHHGLHNIDAIWDSASFSAIEPNERMEYGKLLKSLVGTGTKYLLETTDRPPDQGPSYYISKEEIETSFGPGCVAQEIDYFKYNEIGFDFDSEGVNGYFIYYLTFN